MNENQQLEALNQHPLNRQAAKLLAAAKQQPDPSQLHLFQLAEWRLNQPSPQVENPLRLEQWLGNLQARPPQQQLECLLAPSPELPEEQDRLSKSFLSEKNPLQAGDSLLQVLNLHAQERVPYWDKT